MTERNKNRVVRPGILIAALVAGAVAVIFSVLIPGDETWKERISTSFVGITNSPGGVFAVICISNGGPRSIVRRDGLIVEGHFFGPSAPAFRVAAPVGGAAARTNFVIGPSKSADFLMPIGPGQGDFIVTLQFSRDDFLTKAWYYISQRKELRFLPWKLSGVPLDRVSQACTTQGTGNQPINAQ